MTKSSAIAALICLAGASAFSAMAQTPDDGKGRYALSPVDGGVLKLDKETGAVSLCARKGDAWTCEAVKDVGSPGDVARLESENKDLKARVKALEDDVAATVAPLEPPAPKAQLPTEEEVDKALDYVENIFKKFRDRIRKYEGDPPAPGDAAPSDSGKGSKQL
ncbi:MAG: hypothetical protein ACT4OU_03470 [Hyphomicrobium sp.]